MWVGTKYEEIKETKISGHELFSKKLEIGRKIIDHFGGELTSEKFDKLFNMNYFIEFGTDILLKDFGHCEFCSHYIGIGSKNRKMFKVSVLNSYCNELLKTIKPLDRCRYWEPSNLYEQIIMQIILKESNGNLSYVNWLYLGDDPHKYDDHPFKEIY